MPALTSSRIPGRRVRGPRLARALYQSVLELTAPARPLPDYLIVGAQRSGTTSLHDALAKHPAVGAAKAKEVHYFDLNSTRSEAWYRSHFPIGRVTQRRARRAQAGQCVAGEATPYYLFHPDVPARAHALVPDARLVAVLREPVSRAISQYHHEVLRGRETRPIEVALTAELDGDMPVDSASDRHQTQSYLARGRYIEQIDRWMRYYRPDQLHVVFSEELFGDPEAALAGVCGHIGVSYQGRMLQLPHSNARRYAGAASDLRDRLANEFSAPNLRLAEFLGRPTPWPISQ